jgi:hypothetical protein
VVPHSKICPGICREGLRKTQSGRRPIERENIYAEMGTSGGKQRKYEYNYKNAVTLWNVDAECTALMLIINGAVRF